MLIVETHATSHIGRVRKGNEDNFLLLDISRSNSWTSSQALESSVIESQEFEIDPNGIVLAVSDGMGGALAGEVASKMAVDTVSESILNENPEKTTSPENFGDSLTGRLFDATVYSNYLIHQRGREPEFQGMGATFTSVAITLDEIGLIQVGDSRIYLIRGDDIKQVTKDQSFVQQLIDSGQISPEEAETHAFKNVILQALGAQNEIYPVATSLVPQRDDVLVICSDGLSNKIDAEDIQKIVFEYSSDLKTACAELVKEANDRGGEDNITVILAKLTGSGLPEPTNEEVKLETLNPDSIHDTADQDTAEIL